MPPIDNRRSCHSKSNHTAKTVSRVTVWHLAYKMLPQLFVSGMGCSVETKLYRGEDRPWYCARGFLRYLDSFRTVRQHSKSTYCVTHPEIRLQTVLSTASGANVGTEESLTSLMASGAEMYSSSSSIPSMPLSSSS